MNLSLKSLKIWSLIVYPHQIAFYEEFGIRRTNPEIWQYAGWFNAQHEKYRGIHAG
jgi:hypothetical protein